MQICRGICFEMGNFNPVPPLHWHFPHSCPHREVTHRTCTVCGRLVLVTAFRRHQHGIRLFPRESLGSAKVKDQVILQGVPVYVHSFQVHLQRSVFYRTRDSRHKLQHRKFSLNTRKHFLMVGDQAWTGSPEVWWTLHLWR